MTRKLSLVVIGALLLVACSGGGPGATVKQFFTLVEDGKVNDAMELMAPGIKDMMQAMGGGGAVFGEGTKEIKDKGGIKKINILKEEVTGDLAEVEVEIEYGDGSSETETMQLTKVDGKWRISPDK
jgi:hypothetical protein